MNKILILIIRFYQITLSPIFGNRCRFHPSCSNYCIEALQQHGIVRGLWYGIKRIGSCHPFHSGGFNPVPPPKKNKK